MKKRIISLACLFALVLTVFTACTKGAAASDGKTSDPKSAAVLSAYVVETNQKSKTLLVGSSDGLNFVYTENAVIEKDGKTLSFEDIKPGMTVKIGYDGCVLESYPGQIPNTETIKVVSQEDDKISLFKKMFMYIFENKEDLEDETTIALDLTKITSLSQEQKTALIYVLSNYFFGKTDADVIEGSYEELKNSGRLKDDCSFPGGIILSVGENEDGTFFGSWWKGGLCASGFDKAKAKMKNGEWIIDYGSFWIS